MKSLRIILSGLVCMTALVFVSCDKNNGDDDNGSSTDDKNYVVYGDKTYDIVHIGGGYMDEVGEIGGEAGYRFSLYIGSDNIHCFPRLSKSCEGKTIDLTKHNSGVNYSLDVNDNDNVMDIHQFNYSSEFFGILNRGRRQEGTIFNSGTMQITQKDKMITFKVDGVLKDGKVFKINAKFESTSEY